MSLEQPDFDSIFASGCKTGEVLEWSNADYLRGWGYLGKSEPPPMEYFNRLQNLADLKAQYLWESASLRKNDTTYTQGDIVVSPNLGLGYALYCVTGGTTASTEPDLESLAADDLLTDGTVTWQVIPKSYKITEATDDEVTDMMEEVCG